MIGKTISLKADQRKVKRIFIIDVKDGILLIPKPSDPVKEIEEVGKEFPDKIIKELRREIKVYEKTGIERIKLEEN